MVQFSNGDQRDRYRAVTRSNVAKLPQWADLDPELREAVEVVSLVLPFRTNRYVTDHLIDWSNVPNDPMFQLTFPQRGMLSEEHYDSMLALMRSHALGNTSKAELEAEADRIRLQLNPHPAGQLTHNVPTIVNEEGHRERVEGMQHKYAETVLFFPSHGQTCHAYCTFCFRWAQFVGLEGLKFANREVEQLVRYLHQHPEVTDVLFTGGDPMVMKTRVLAEYIRPLLDVESVRSIRIGTKSVAYWPQRFVTDEDADECLRLFESIVRRGKHLSVMGHYCHPVELSTRVARQAVRRIRSTGANVRMQSPMVRHVNDDPHAWAELWRTGVQLGAIPYYFFVERDTGARKYFEVPLARCWDIFQSAYRQVSGLARTVRGPSMSAWPGKVHILGITRVGEQKAFVLEYLQARDPSLVRRPFFARFDPDATWFTDLQPLTEADARFWPQRWRGRHQDTTTTLHVQGRPRACDEAQRN
ncbi:MAG: KamA family radical SAM protein [Phycisphaerales bacterium]